MDSLGVIYSLLPTIINALLSAEDEQGLPYELLTKKMLELCRNINTNGMPISHSQLKQVTSTGLNITLESLIVAAFYHYRARLDHPHSDDEASLYNMLNKAMKTLQMKPLNPNLLNDIPRAHALKVLFNIHFNHSKIMV